MKCDSIAAVVQEGQNGSKWFVDLWPANELYANIYSGAPMIGHITFYILQNDNISGIRAYNVQLNNIEWFQGAFEFLKSFSQQTQD